MNLGPTGLAAKLNERSFTVMTVDGDGPAAGRVRKGEEIVGVGGKLFTTPHHFGFGWEHAQFGYQGPMMDFGNAIEDAEGGDGVLTLMIKREGKTVDVQIKIRSLGRFSDTFPFNCEKSDRIYSEICEYLSVNMKGSGWGGPVHTAPCALTLLGSGDPKYLPHVKRAAHGLTGIKPYADGLYNWNLTYAGVFLGEYYLATSDAQVVDAMKRISAGLAFAQSGDYSFCHGKLFPEHSAYPELGIMNGQAAMAWGLIRSCGIEIDEHRCEMLLKRLRFTTRPDGHVSYARPSHPGWEKDAPRPFTERTRAGEGVGRGGAAALGYCLSGRRDPEAAEYIKHVCRYLTQYQAYFPDTHGCPEVGIQWMGLALASGYPEGFWKVMDYHKAWLNLSRCHQPGQFESMPCRSDAWSDWDRTWMSGTVGLLFCTKERKLRLTGARVYIVGLSPNKLSRYTSAAYELMSEGELAKAFEHLNRLSAKIAANEEDARAAELMKTYIVERAAPMIVKLQEMDEQPDVVALREKLDRYQKLYRGITPFDEVAGPIEESFAKEPRKSELKAGKAYRQLIAGRSRAYRWSTYLGKLDAFAKKYPDSYYAKAAAKETESIETMARSIVADFEKCKQWGDLYTLSERLKKASRKFAGLAVFDEAAFEYRKLVTTTENRQAVSRGREYYKVFADAARLREMIVRMAVQKKPYPEAMIKRAFARLARRLEGFAKRNPDSVYGKAAQEALKHYEQSNKMDVREVWFSSRPARDARDTFLEGTRKRELNNMRKE